MPSPFPGTDPYLERPSIFPNLHNSFIIYLQETLQPLLPAAYYASTGERTWVELSERYVEPDVSVRTSRVAPARQDFADGGVAVASPPRSRVVVVPAPLEERKELFLEIHRAAGGDEATRLVTTVEVLSPSNKTPGRRSRDLYLQKQQEHLQTDTHLVEIDLLRAGTHTTAVPLDRVRSAAGPFDYHVCVHRFHHLEEFLVYPIRLEEPLPTVEVPLLPGDGGVSVNLQAVFDRCYSAGPYAKKIHYRRDSPIPALSPEQAEWAHACIDAALSV